MKDIRKNIAKKNRGKFECLNLSWFDNNQKTLLWLLNNKITKRWFRWVLRIQKDVGYKEDIDKLLPNAYRVPLGLQRHEGEIVEMFRWDHRTSPKFAKRIFYAFQPVWALLHYVDWVLLDRFEKLNAFSFGFTTYTHYPDAHVETSSVDGFVAHENNSSWSTVLAASAGTASNDSSTSAQRPSLIWSGGATNMGRSFYLFDTASISETETIASSTMSVKHSQSFVNDTYSSDIVCCSSSPASNTALVTGDWDQVGSTSFSRVTLASFPSTNVYVDWVLNASGIANIDSTGVSKFALRIGDEFDNSEPVSNGAADVGGLYFADQTGTDKDPKLVTITASAFLPSMIIF